MKSLLRAEFYKLRILRIFRILLVSVLFSAIASVAIVKILGDVIADVPDELLEQMRFNGVYNFGFIQVNNISDLSNLSSSYVISSAFTNFCPTISAAVFVSIFLSAEFKNGGIRNFLLKGFDRNRVLLSKHIVMAVAVMSMLCLYFMGYVIASVFLFGASGMDGAFILRLASFLITEIFLIASFASICFMTAIVIRRPAVSVLNVSLVLGGTMMINNVMVLTNGRIDLSRFWVLDYVTGLTPLGDVAYWPLFLTGAITLIVPLVITIRKFNRIQFEDD